MDKFIESFSELAGEFKKLKEENDEWRQVCDDFDTPDEVEIMIDDLKECVGDLSFLLMITNLWIFNNHVLIASYYLRIYFVLNILHSKLVVYLE